MSWELKEYARNIIAPKYKRHETIIRINKTKYLGPRALQ